MADAAPLPSIQHAARLLTEGRTKEATAELEALATAFPAYATAHVLLAKAYETDERLDAALDAWHRAFFLLPGSPLVRRQRARLLQRVPPPAPEDPPEPVAESAPLDIEAPPAENEPPTPAETAPEPLEDEAAPDENGWLKEREADEPLDEPDKAPDEEAPDEESPDEETPFFAPEDDEAEPPADDEPHAPADWLAEPDLEEEALADDEPLDEDAPPEPAEDDAPPDAEDATEEPLEEPSDNDVSESDAPERDAPEDDAPEDSDDIPVAEIRPPIEGDRDEAPAPEGDDENGWRLLHETTGHRPQNPAPTDTATQAPAPPEHAQAPPEPEPSDEPPLAARTDDAPADTPTEDDSPTENDSPTDEPPTEGPAPEPTWLDDDLDEALDLGAFNLGAFDPPEPETIEPDAFEPDAFEPDTFEPDTFEPDTFEPDTFEPDADEGDADEAPFPEDVDAGRPGAQDPFASTLLGDIDDLDALIEQLEKAPRIRPDPHFVDDDESLQSGGEELVSETLARIYETQQQYAHAARAYEQLARQQPDRAEEFLARAEALRHRT